MAAAMATTCCSTSSPLCYSYSFVSSQNGAKNLRKDVQLAPRGFRALSLNAVSQPGVIAGVEGHLLVAMAKTSKLHQAIQIQIQSATNATEEWVNVSRRQALLAALVATVPTGIFIQLQGCSQALAVEDEAMKVQLIQYELKKVLSKGKSAGVLRLAFHDAGTFDSSDNSGGMNGSIIFELERPESAGLQRPIKVLQKVKSQLDLAFPVSWADLIAVAGAQAVAECDGPIIPVKLGRIDSSEPDPEGKMPEETLSISALKEAFQSKGFTTQELVALSGAHTLGNKGFGNPNLFDNSYFQILLQKPWENAGTGEGMTSMIGLATDRVLGKDEECLEWIKVYAADQGRFFNDFTAAYTKLVGTGARWGSMKA